jgi:kumamolisin
MAQQPKTHLPLTGSDREPLEGATRIGPADPSEQIEVTVLLRPKQQLPAGARLTHEQLEAAHGADPQDITRVQAFAHEHNLAVGEIDPGRRTVELSGTVADFSKAFAVQLDRYQHASGQYRGRTGPVSIPADLAPIVQGVFGLDDRPQLQPHFRGRAGTTRNTSTPSYTPPQVAALYDFPKGLNGSGQQIGILEFGGGFRPKDIKTYFSFLGITAPKVVAVSIDGAHNRPSTPNGADMEVMLDIEVAGAVAPGAGQAVYFAPNTDRGFIDAVTKSIHDKLHKPSVISISWGGPESTWTSQTMQAIDQAFQEAAALGITVCVASGDNGSSDGVSDGLNHVDFPASSPNVLACGGTHLEGAGGTIQTETVWSDPNGGATGGGFSDVFGLPSWQAGIPTPSGKSARGLPDVAGDADPATGYRIEVDGQETVVGGTSAVAPLWAGLVALMNQQQKSPVGFLNPRIYAPPKSQSFHDITQGSNGNFTAGPGWDACTGLGSPDGAKLLAALVGAVPAATATRP